MDIWNKVEHYLPDSLQGEIAEFLGPIGIDALADRYDALRKKVYMHKFVELGKKYPRMRYDKRRSIAKSQKAYYGPKPKMKRLYWNSSRWWPRPRNNPPDMRPYVYSKKN